MGLRAQVDDMVGNGVASDTMCLAGCYHSRECGNTSARSQIALRGIGIAHHTGQPLDQRLFHARRPWRRVADAGISIGDRCQIIRQCRFVKTAAGNVGEKPARSEVVSHAVHVLIEDGKRMLERGWRR